MNPIVRNAARRRVTPGVVLTAIAAAVTAALLFPSVSIGASIPAWLDDGITKWNSAHPDAKIQFVAIRDSFVWYDMAKASEQGHKEIRQRINDIVLANGYTPTDDEELITTAKPPATSGRVTEKKCWSRSFVLDIQSQSNTKAAGDESPGQRQRLLTSLVCDDASVWWAAFRVAG